MPRKKLTPEEKAATAEEKATLKNTEWKDYGEATNEPIQNNKPSPEVLKDAEIAALKRELEAAKEILEAAKEIKEQKPIKPAGTFLSLAESQAQAQHEMLSERRAQVRAGTFERIKGNKDEAYEFPEWEKDLIHVLITMRPPENVRGKNFVTENGKTFEKTELPVKVWKGNIQQFARMEKGNTFKAYQGVRILHDPRIN